MIVSVTPKSPPPIVIVKDDKRKKKRIKSTYTLDEILNQYLCVISSILPSFKQNPPPHAINRTMVKTAESRETPQAVLLAEKIFYYLYS